MGLLDRFRRTQEEPERVIVPNHKVRAAQLMQLEGAILDVMDEMERSPHWRNPGWQAQVQEFYLVLGTIRHLRPREFGWSQLVDLGFEVRPVMRMQQTPEGLEKLAELQSRMMTIARALTQPMPEEIQPVS